MGYSSCYTKFMATIKVPKVETPPVLDHLSAGAADTTRIAWEAPAFAYYEKSWLWMGSVVLVGLIFLGVFFYLKDYSAMAVVVAGTAVFLQQARKKPEQVQYAVDNEGIKVGDKLFNWTELKSFWLIDETGGGHLYLETTNRLLPVRTIHLANVEPSEVRARLVQHLPERTTKSEELADRILRIIKF
jgi:hypothetical protein